MKTGGRRPGARTTPSTIIADLRARLNEAEETLRAIRSGAADALVIEGPEGPRVYTREGAERAYRLLIESMNEGALMISADKLILYANRRFARMLGRPLGRVIGHSFRQFLSAADRSALKSLLGRDARPASSIQVLLRGAGDRRVPAQLSVRRLSRDGPNSAAFSVVVTDMTEARRNEELLRGLSHSLLQSQETDRRRLAAALHDQASQALGALLVRLRLLAGNLPEPAEALRREVEGISELVETTAGLVEDISRNLRPSVLEILGLVPALRAAIGEFVHRTGIPVTFACARIPARLSAEADLVLYRILEEALTNVGKHSAAHNATVQLKQRGAAVLLEIRDDGVGFDSGRSAAGDENRGVGLIGLRERAASVGGALRIRSTRGAGTRIEARIPLPSRATGGAHHRSSAANAS